MKRFLNKLGLFNGTVGGLIDDKPTQLQGAMRKIGADDYAHRDAMFGKLKPSTKPMWDSCHDRGIKAALDKTTEGKRQVGGSMAFEDLCGSPALMGQRYGQQLDADLANVTHRMGDVKRLINNYLREFTDLESLYGQLVQSRANFASSNVGKSDAFPSESEMQRVWDKMRSNENLPLATGTLEEMRRVCGVTFGEPIDHLNSDGTVSTVIPTIERMDKETDAFLAGFSESLESESFDDDSAGETNPSQGSDETCQTNNQAVSESSPTA